MPKLFEIETIKPEQQVQSNEKSEILRDNYLKMHEYKVQTLKELNGRLPLPGEFFAIWTMKSFNAFTFIPYLIHATGNIKQLILSTYSINRRIIDSLAKKIDQGKIKKVELFISDSIKFRMPKVFDHLTMMKENRNITIHYLWNHSKITLAECEGSNFIVEGSGNWSENARFEQYLFFNHDKLFQFRHKNLHDAIH